MVGWKHWYPRRIARAAERINERTPRNKRRITAPGPPAGRKLVKGRGLARRRPPETDWLGLILIGAIAVLGGIAYFLFYLWLITP